MTFIPIDPGPYGPFIPELPEDFSIPEPTPAASLGWVCPKCGGGNAPHVSRCPCSPVPITVGDYSTPWNGNWNFNISSQG